MMRCLAPDCQMGGLGCDNMSVVLICLTPASMTYSDLAARCAMPMPTDSATTRPISELANAAEETGHGEGGGGAWE